MLSISHQKVGKVGKVRILNFDKNKKFEKQQKRSDLNKYHQLSKMLKQQALSFK
jgi:hypothetical protein